MKNVNLIVFVLLFLGCTQERIPKPKPLLTPEQMTRFHVDLAILSASSSYVKDSFVPLDSLYKFHKIDSITFAKNNIYYASKPKVYIKIFEAAKEELEGYDEIDSLLLLKSPLLKE